MADKDSGSEANYPAEASQPAGRPAFGIFPMLSLLALAIALVALVITLSDMQQKTAWMQEQQSLAKRVQDNNREQQKAFAALQSANAQKSDNQQQQITALAQSFQSLKAEQRYLEEDWLLLKARYFLELAEIQAHWGDNPALVIALLQEADRLLSTTANSKLFDVRQSLAGEILRLKSLPAFDLAGMLSRLDAQQKAVDSLNVNQNLTLPAESSPEKSKASSWRDHWKASLNTLEKMVIIRHHDEEIQPLYSSQEIRLLRERLRNNLQEAKWGLLHNNQAVYQLALDEAMDNLKSSFDPEAKNTRAFLQELKTLKALPFPGSTALDLQASIELLNKIINAKPAEPKS